MTHRLGLWIVMAAVLCIAPLAVHAEEDEPATSDAETAFRAAWWAETSEGALDLALQGYRAAVAAEGPVAIRARAQYRQAIVLERMGRTDEAIRVLERLALDFPDEADLQAKARDRLEEWTAVDLRSNFDEWYRRYQYSPEFQARIVNLVLALSSASNTNTVKAAEQELLTIGEPCVAALRAHVDSSNTYLRRRVVSLLLQLGDIPPIRALLGTHEWRRSQAAWSVLLSLAPTDRASLLADVEGAGPQYGVLRAALGGPDSWAEALGLDMSMALLDALLDGDPSDALIEDLHDLVDRIHTEGQYLEARLIERLALHKRIDEQRLVSWLRHVSPRARESAAKVLGQGRVRPSGAVPAIADAMLATAPADQMQTDLWDALQVVLTTDTSDADLAKALQAIEHAHPGGRLRMMGTRGQAGMSVEARARLLEAIVERTRSPTLAMQAASQWVGQAPSGPAVTRQLLAWATSPLDLNVRKDIARHAGSGVGAEGLDAVLEALETLDAEVAEGLLRGMEGNQGLRSLTWSKEQLAALMLWIGSDGTRQSKARGLFKRLCESTERVRAIVDIALENPRHEWAVALEEAQRSAVRNGLSTSLAVHVRGQVGLRWARWTIGQKQAAVAVLPRVWGSVSDDALFTTHLRAKLHVPFNWEIPAADAQERRALLQSVLRLLPKPTLKDVAAAFHLEKPESAISASGLEHLPRTAEVYEALAAARQSVNDHRRTFFWNTWLDDTDGDFRRRVLKDMMKDPHDVNRVSAISYLSTYRNPKDVSLFRRALNDDSPSVRIAAARAFTLVYDSNAVRDLVDSLNDREPTVQDAVLETLEAIKAIEQKKNYFRRHARDGYFPPDGD